MAAKITTEEFIGRCLKHYKDVFDFSNTNYNGRKNKVKVICCKCGLISWIAASSLLQGKTCCPCVRKRKRRSTEDFIEESKKIHNNFFDYTLTVFENLTLPVKIICPVHGVWEQYPGNHLKGCGCPRCRDSSRITTLAVLKEKIQHVHGNDKFSYCFDGYKNNKSYINITCLICGNNFKQLVSGHLSGAGCDVCAKRATADITRGTTETFIKKAKKVHGDFAYDYSQVDYTAIRCKVKIGCNSCGRWWEQIAENHLKGHKCSCKTHSGFSTKKAGSIYILRCDTYKMIKVGITNRSVTTRCRDICKSSGLVFDVAFYIKLQNGDVAAKAEQEALSLMRSLYKSPDEAFDGSTECFMSNNVEEAKKIIADAVSKTIWQEETNGT